MKVDKKQDFNVLYQVFVFRAEADWKTNMAAQAFGWLDFFNFFLQPLNRIQWNFDRKQDLNFLYQVCVFQANPKSKMATPASSWLRHFWLLLFNPWMEFNETWQETSTQHPPPCLCFFGLIIISMCSIPKWGTSVKHCGPLGLLLYPKTKWLGAYCFCPAQLLLHFDLNHDFCITCKAKEAHSDYFVWVR